jgi:hypothetical protein
MQQYNLFLLLIQILPEYNYWQKEKIKKHFLQEEVMQHWLDTLMQKNQADIYPTPTVQRQYPRKKQCQKDKFEEKFLLVGHQIRQEEVSPQSYIDLTKRNYNQKGYLQY